MSSNPKITPIESSLRELLQLSARAFGPAGGDLPAKVLSYNAATQTVDAQPVVLVPGVQGLKAAPIARQVQVRWPAGATWSIVGELVAGDFGWLRVAGADISTWKMQGTELDPLALERSGSGSDVVFEPGSQPVSVPLAADAYKAGALVVKAAELLLGDSTATKALALYGDAVNKDASSPPADFASWMASIEAIANAGLGGTVTPSAATITKLGYVDASATKVKAK